MQHLRKSFEKDGYVRIPQEMFCLEESTIQELRNEFEKLFSGDYETGIYPDEIHWRPGMSNDYITREICNAWKSSSVIAEIVCSEKLGKLAADLMGWRVVRMGQDDILHKPPMSNAVGFHQDGAYISDNFLPLEHNCLTMWIALDDADEENGALQYATGSHRWPYKKVDTAGTSSFHTVGAENETQNEEKRNDESGSYLEPLREAAQLAGEEPGKVLGSVKTVPVNVGQLVVHHQQLWHGSGPNRSKTRNRRALVAHLINGEVQWRTSPRPHYIYGRYHIRGEPNLREDFFPILYSELPGIERTSWLSK